MARNMSPLTTGALWDDDLNLLPCVKVPTPILRPSSPHNFDPLLNVTPEKGHRLGQFAGKCKPKGRVHFALGGENPKHQSGKDIFPEVKHPKRERSSEKKSTKSHTDHNSNKLLSNNKHKSVTKQCSLLESRKQIRSTKGVEIQTRSIKGKVTRLETPKLHSTGALEQKLQNIELEEFDAEGAVSRTLQQSERVRNEFVERIAEAVNVPKDYKKYTGLVSLDVPAEGVGNCAVAEKVPRSRKSKRKDSSKASTGKQPDIMECFRPDMLTDVADLSSVTHIPHYEVRPTLVPVESAFDIYRHMQQWQGL